MAGDYALAWRNDAGFQSHVVSNHHQKEGLAMAESNCSSVPAGFKEIPEYDGRYFINEQGDVWSAFKRDLMSPQTDATHPYPWVLLREGNRSQPRTVYYLMRLTWMDRAPGVIGRRRGEWCVNHIDDNKLNSHISNLEWITVEQNTSHAWQNGLNTQIGDTSTSSVLSSAVVRNIRFRLINGEKPAHIAKEYGVTKQCAEKLRMYASWKHQDHDLIKSMMQVSNSTTLRAFYSLLSQGLVLSKAYERVEQKVPDNVVLELAKAVLQKKLELASALL